MLPVEIESRREEIQNEVAKLGAELVDIIVRRSNGTSTIVIIADKSGGITLDDCATVNRRLSDYFDELTNAAAENSFLQGRYFIEVNSPGLDRPLVTPKDFLRVKGELVRVVYRDPAGRVVTAVGSVLEASDGMVNLSVEGQELALRLDAIIKAERELQFKR